MSLQKSAMLAMVAVTLMLLADEATTTLSSEVTTPPSVSQVLVRMHRNSSAPSSSGLSSSASYNPTLDVWRLDLLPGISSEHALSELADDPSVAFVQPNFVYQAATVPNDPEFNSMQRAYYASINAEAGWSRETGNPDTVVAVLDAGVDVNNPELEGRAWRNPQEIANGVDDDSNGCIDDLSGCNFLPEKADGDITDLTGHGTFVSGIIGAKGNNGVGVAGLAWGVTIMPVKVLDTTGLGTTEELASGVLYAARNGAQVENLSLSLPPEAGDCPTDGLVEEALSEAHDEHGVIIVAAAGNAGVGCVSYPASSSYTIGVGGSGGPGDSDSKAFFSQWGSEVDVAAPSIDVYSLLSSGGFGLNLGTSFATPFVSGLSALLLSHDGTLSNEDVRNIIKESARDLPDGNNPNWDGAGLIDVGAALAAPSPFATINMSVPDPGALALRVAVGDESDPSCEAILWSGFEVRANPISASFAVPGCEYAWPPNPDQPWRLIASRSIGKASVVQALSIRMGKLSCPFEGLPAIVTRTERVVASTECEAPAVVQGDSVDDATMVSAERLPRSFVRSALYATSVDEPPISCAESFSQTLWFEVPPGGSEGALAADTFGAKYDTVLAVFAGSPGNLQEVACNDDHGSPQSRVVWQTDGESHYYLMAAAFGQVPAGQLTVSFSRAAIPANDTLIGARTLTAGDVFVMPTHSATQSVDEPKLSCAPGQGHTVWFEVPQISSFTLTLGAADSDYDTVIGVYANAGDGMKEVACNDDAEPGVRSSRVEWEVEPGRTYYALVAAYSDRPGGTLRLRLIGSPAL